MPSTLTSKASSAAAAAAAAKAQQLARAKQHMLNVQASKHFAEAIVGVIILFTLFHWIRYAYARYASKVVKESKIMKAQVSIGRVVRRIFLKRVPGFTTTGHTLLVVAYISINVVLIFTNIDWSNLIGISKRFGWLSISNAAFIVFLALKNTPLAYITQYSHERLNILHQVGGYTTVTCAVLHMILMSVGFFKLNRISVLLEQSNIMGMISLAAFFVLFLFAVFIRRFSYEIFYISHISLFIVSMVTFGFHQPDLSGTSLIIAIFAVSIWFSDRLIRGTRILYYSFGSNATSTPLPNGGTRIVIHRAPSRAVAGTHCFLWVPRIRAFETHPFTIASKTATSMELVMAAYDGFTGDMHKFAVDHPGATFRASIDGPYGSVPNFKSKDKTIFIAGGSGASFTFGAALEMIRQLGDASNKTIHFVWSVRRKENLSWFSKELAELQASPLVNIFLHVTGPNPTSPPSSSSHHSHEKEDEKAVLEGVPPISASASGSEKHLVDQRDKDSDIEKGQENTATQPWRSTTSLELDILSEKPDVAKYIMEIVGSAREEERVAVVGCGPEGMMWAIRRAAGSCVRVGGPSVDLYCEQFGW